MIENPLPDTQITSGPCLDIVRRSPGGRFTTRVPGNYVVYKNGEKILEAFFEEDEIVYEFTSDDMTNDFAIYRI